MKPDYKNWVPKSMVYGLADRPRSCLAGTFRLDAACRKEIDNNNAFRVNRMRERFLPANG